MPTRRLRLSAAVVALALPALGCHGSSPIPTAPSAPPAEVTQAPAPPSGVPPVSTSGRTFTYSGPASYPVRPYTQQSSYVLGSDGQFALAYSHAGGFQYLGRFTESGNQVTFYWEGSAAAGPWGAIGTLDEGTLTIRYNLVMQMSDFEDAVYTLASSEP
jgi:hypothetical protein